MQTALFVLFINLTNGNQVEVYRTTIPETACIELMESIWADPTNPIAYKTDDFDVVTVDATCEPIFN